MSPQRIQRKRTRGWRMPEGAIYVGRPSKWGNIFKLGDHYMWMRYSELPFPVSTSRDPGEYDHGITVVTCESAAQAVEWFSAYMRQYPTLRFEARVDLVDSDLCCWCPLDQPCHADVLLEIANGGTS